jgi:hypothetical protein
MKVSLAAPRQHGLVSVVVLLGSVAGCAEDRASTTATTTDSAGVRIVSSAGPGWAPAEAWSLELVLDIGATDGPYAFGSIREVAPRGSGGLLILEGQAQRIRAYDEAGTEVAA